MEKEAKEIWDKSVELVELAKASTNKAITFVILVGVPKDEKDTGINNCMGATVGDPLELGSLMNQFLKKNDLLKFMVADKLISKLRGEGEKIGGDIEDMGSANKIPV